MRLEYGTIGIIATLPKEGPNANISERQPNAYVYKQNGMLYIHTAHGYLAIDPRNNKNEKA